MCQVICGVRTQTDNMTVKTITISIGSFILGFILALVLIAYCFPGQVLSVSNPEVKDAIFWIHRTIYEKENLLEKSLSQNNLKESEQIIKKLLNYYLQIEEFKKENNGHNLMLLYGQLALLYKKNGDSENYMSAITNAMHYSSYAFTKPINSERAMINYLNKTPSIVKFNGK